MVPGHPYCFYNGGCFQSYLALSAPPMNTFSGIIAQLTSLPERDFSIIVNIEALDVAKEVEKAEKELTKLRRAVRSHPKASMLQEIEEAENRVRRLTSREQHPMKAQVLLHVWARSAEELVFVAIDLASVALVGQPELAHVVAQLPVLRGRKAHRVEPEFRPQLAEGDRRRFA